MGLGAQMEKVKDLEVRGETMRNETGLLTLIEQHRKSVLSSPFVLAIILGLVYVFGGNEFRRVIDFIAPGRILGQ
jgi:hypothetical protein